MLQEHSQPSNPSERPGKEPLIAPSTFGFRGQFPLSPNIEGNALAFTPNHYWQLFNGLGLSHLGTIAGQPTVSTEVFLNLTQQVQALTGIMQTIIPLIPHSPSRQCCPNGCHHGTTRPPSMRLKNLLQLANNLEQWVLTRCPRGVGRTRGRC